MNIFTEEMVPAYSNLGLGTTSICNYKVGLVTWLPGESPPSRHEDCDTPFTLFHSRFTNHSTDHKLPVLYVKLQGDYIRVTNSVCVDIKMTYAIT